LASVVKFLNPDLQKEEDRLEQNDGATKPTAALFHHRILFLGLLDKHKVNLVIW